MLSTSGVGPENSEGVREVIKPPVERLSDPQKAKIEKIAELSFNDIDWAEIEVARNDFASIYRTKFQVLEDRQCAKRLEAIANSLDHAIDALRAPPRNHDGDRISAHRRAQLKSIENAHKNYSRLRWTALILTLASIFDAHGCKPTAAKWGRSSELRQRSLFVDFVQAVLETLPSVMNDHRKSVGALSKIVSGKLKLHRAVRNFLKTGRNESIR